MGDDWRRSAIDSASDGRADRAEIVGERRAGDDRTEIEGEPGSDLRRDRVGRAARRGRIGVDGAGRQFLRAASEDVEALKLEKERRSDQARRQIVLNLETAVCLLA
jgi:hypothetical protein